ncbi:IucA/IucC family C-terminal-domain containing protein [Paenibacillus sp. strain BS8-2]
MSGENDLASREAAASLLRYFAIHLAPWSDSDYPYSSSDFICENSLTRILDRQSAALGNPESHVTGTLFAKRYSVWARGVLAAFSLYDTPLDLAHENVKFRLADRGMMLYAAEPSREEGLTKTNRSTFARTYMNRLREHLAPIFKAVSSNTGASETVMWSLVGHNVYSLYGSLTDSTSSYPLSTNRLELVMQDWQALALTETMGPARYTRFNDPLWQGPPVYVRAYCCLAYQLGGKGQEEPDYCETCPKLSAERRLLMLSSEPK